MKTKICTKCKKRKRLSEFSKHKHCKFGVRTYCKKCVAAISKELYDTNPKVRIANRRRHLIREYNLTLEDYDKMFEIQNGCCKICGQPQQTVRLHVDHSHETGKIRGLLCITCNTYLGWYEKQKLKIKNYLGE